MKGKDWPQQGKPWRTLPGADISPTKLASKASRNLALEYRLRKPRTAARFGPRKKNERKRLAPARNRLYKACLKTWPWSCESARFYAGPTYRLYKACLETSSRNLALEYRLRKPRKGSKIRAQAKEHLCATTKTTSEYCLSRSLERRFGPRNPLNKKEK